MFALKRIAVYMVSCSLVLSGCANTVGPSTFKVGPQFSSFFDTKKSDVASRPKLDIIVPVFDPGLPEDASAEEGVWPELRRAEANRFAVKLKDALEGTGAFGAVRITPDSTATGDLYVLGRIAESNGEDVEIDIEVIDISGKKWFAKSFDHEVDESFHTNARNDGKDPYEPVFVEAADYLAEELDDYEAGELAALKNLSTLRFGANFSEGAFAHHMETARGVTTILSMPNDADPMLQRTRAIRVRDQLFVDSLQQHYRDFSHDMDASYAMWQEHSLMEIQAERAAKLEAAGEAAAGVLLIGLAILSAAAGANSDSYSGTQAGAAGAVVAGMAGASMLSESFQTSEEAKIHREALEELGASLDLELGPQVVDFEERTVELTGDAKEQFAQWRDFLKKLYALESTPQTQL